MKGTKMLLVGFFCLSLAVYAQGQSAKLLPESALTEPYRLEVACSKTTHLVFPFSIVSVDRGSESILAQKATGVENILRVKGGQKNFEQTSLGVITSDGKLYSFLVDYNACPAYLNVNLDSTGSQTSIVALKQKANGSLNEALLANYAKLVLGADKNSHRPKAKEGRVLFTVEGIYVKENLLFFRLQLHNGSAIRYDVDQLRLFVRDKVQSKRMAVQEKEVEPIMIEGDVKIVGASNTKTFVVAVPAFTLSKDKLFIIGITEKGGSRNLTLKVKSGHILKAQPLK
jgi:conjugative transposon TraN protein